MKVTEKRVYAETLKIGPVIFLFFNKQGLHHTRKKTRGPAEAPPQDLEQKCAVQPAWPGDAVPTEPTRLWLLNVQAGRFCLSTDSA